MEDLDLDLVRDMKTLRSFMIIRWILFRVLRLFFLEIFCRWKESLEVYIDFKFEVFE